MNSPSTHPTNTDLIPPFQRGGKGGSRQQSLLILLTLTTLATPVAACDEAATPLIIAHRGASHDAPENTLAAFRIAWEQNADGIEADFFLSRDGHIVCTHDENTKRTTGVDRKVAESTLEELKQLDVGSWKSKDWAGQRMPTIQQVFDTVPDGKKIYVEIKCGPEIVPALKDALARSKLQAKQVVVICFKEEVVAEIRKELSALKAIWLVDYYQDDATGKWLPSLPDILKRLKQCNAHGLGTQANRQVVNAAFVKQLREAGFEFHTWTVNDPSKATHFHRLGVDSITTDRPAYIRSELGLVRP